MRYNCYKRSNKCYKCSKMNTGCFKKSIYMNTNSSNMILNAWCSTCITKKHLQHFQRQAVNTQTLSVLAAHAQSLLPLTWFVYNFIIFMPFCKYDALVWPWKYILLCYSISLVTTKDKVMLWWGSQLIPTTNIRSNTWHIEIWSPSVQSVSSVPIMLFAFWYNQCINFK